MTRYELAKDTATAKTETRDALQYFYDILNQGQQKKVLKNEKLVEIFDRYGVVYE